MAFEFKPPKTRKPGLRPRKPGVQRYKSGRIKYPVDGMTLSIREDAYDVRDETRFRNELSENGRHTIIVDTRGD